MNFFRYFWLTCTGFRTYVPLLNVSMRSSLGYWAGFSILITLIVMLNFIRWFHIGYPLVAHQAASYLPSFSITNGHAYSTLSQPYITNTNNFPIILDLKGEVENARKTFP